MKEKCTLSEGLSVRGMRRTQGMELLVAGAGTEEVPLLVVAIGQEG